jgi:hypothetical protein
MAFDLLHGTNAVYTLVKHAKLRDKNRVPRIIWREFRAWTACFRCLQR